MLLGEAAGIQAEEITRVSEGPDAPGWTLTEQSLLRAADELLADGAVSGGTWNVLKGEFDDQQLMDVVFTVGAYELVAMALRSLSTMAAISATSSPPRDS